jgi:hypothetical protein
VPRIPLFQHTPQSSGPQQVRADPGMFDQQNAAAARVGQAVAGLGQVAAGAAIQAQQKMKQAQNYKTGAELDIGLQEEWDNFQNNLNPSSDETQWVPQWQKALDARVTKLTPKDAGPETRQQLELKAKAFRVRTSGDIGQQAKVAGVQKATIAGSARVDQLWKNGDVAGAEAELNQMAENGLIFKEKIPALMQAGKESMARAQTSNALNELRNLPPAASKQAMKQFAADVTNKENFGELTLADRLKFQDAAEARAREAQTAMDVSGRRIVGEMRMGRATLESLAAAVDSGELDADTAKAIRPEVEFALAERGERVAEKARTIEAREEAEAKEARGDARSKQSRFESLKADLAPGGKPGSVGMADIDRALQLEQIDSAQAAQLKTQLQGASVNELTSAFSDYRTISDDIRSKLTAKWLGGEPSDEDYRLIQTQIAQAKLSQPTRLRLVDELLQARLADFKNLEEDDADSWMDRKITAPERDLRRTHISELRKQLPLLGDVPAGDFFFSHEQRIRSFFDSAGGKVPSRSEQEAFMNQLRGEIQQAAGSAVLSGVFDF